jgi:CRISPR-associated endonuclease/helicase Cas3
VEEHLAAVAKQAKEYGAEVGMEEQVWIAGLEHDLGKYSERFQKVLCQQEQNIDHAFSSVGLLYGIWCNSGARKINSAKRAVLEAVNGHHAGLLS